jgi:hypothetical protein
MGTINTVKPNPVHTPVENMISQKDIAANAELFTVYLSSWKDTGEEDKGLSFYTFGTIDQNVMKRCGAADFYWTPLVNISLRGFWEFASTTWTLNGKKYNRKSEQKGSNTAIVDTGTTLALVDDATRIAICKLHLLTPFLPPLLALTPIIDNTIPGSKYATKTNATSSQQALTPKLLSPQSDWRSEARHFTSPRRRSHSP